MRAGGCRLIELFEDGCLELYNLRHDISEEHNLAKREPEVAQRLHGVLIPWREQGLAGKPT